jgi:hypothetical protein
VAETSGGATLNNSLNMGSDAVSRTGTGSVCITTPAFTPSNVTAVAGGNFSGQPTSLIVGIVGQVSTPSAFNGTCTAAGDVWVMMTNNGTPKDTWSVYLTLSQ